MIDDFMNRVYEGDCLEVLTKFPDKCIDMVLCDLPYEITENKWDKCIDLPSLWYQYRRIIKPAGVIALTGQGRFTGKLIESNPDWFKYKIVWIKSKATNFLNANKQPLRRHEDICIFYQQQSIYNPQKIQAKPYDKGVRKDKGSGSYGKFNSSRSLNTDGKRFPTDVIAFEEESLTDWIFFKTAESEGVFHPVQKPVNLGRWLIQTYTVPGQIVLDNACGSGSFLVAAIMEKRQFIGIEKNDHSYHFGRKVDYVAITNKRIRLAFQEMNSRLSFD